MVTYSQNPHLEQALIEIAALSKAGLPLSPGLVQLARAQQHLPHSAQALQAVAGALDQGQPLSQALSQGYGSLPHTTQALIRCGELTNNLSELVDLSVQSARRTLRTRCLLESISAYPFAVLGVLFGFYAFLSATVIPSMISMLRDNGINSLPSLTAVIFGPTQWSILGPTLITISTFLSIAILSTLFLPPLRWVIWHLSQFLPGVPQLAQLSDLSLIGTFVSRMAALGLPLADSLRCAALAVVTPQLRETLTQLAERAEKGLTLEIPPTAGLPLNVEHIFTQATKSGQLQQAFQALEAYANTHFEHAERTVPAKLEPILLIVVCLVAGTFVIAAYLPALQLIMNPVRFLP